MPADDVMVAKGNQAVGDPLRLLRANSRHDAPRWIPLQPHDRETERLIEQLDLNSPKHREWRVLWIGTVDLAKKWDRTLYFKLVGFPKDLPSTDSDIDPPSNTRKEGLKHCWFARRQRGELPAEY